MVRFTASLRGQQVDSGTGLWISVIAGSDQSHPAGAMQEPMLRGTFGWRDAAVAAAGEQLGAALRA